MTRGGEALVTGAAGAAAAGVEVSTPGFGTTLVMGRDEEANALGFASLKPEVFSGKRDLVFEVGGAPVRGGAVGLGGSLGMAPEGGRTMFRFGIGFVTAVAQTGAAGEGSTAVKLV